MSQYINNNDDIKRTYWMNDPDNIHGPLAPVYDNEIGGIPNHIYLERTIATDLLMQNDDNFPIVNRVYGGPYPLIDRHIIPPHDPNVNREGITEPPEHIEQKAPSQDDYFAEVDEMLAEADKLISEIVVSEDELDVAAILAEPSEGHEADEISINPIPSPLPEELPADEPQGLTDILLDGDMDAQQPVKRGFRCVTYNAQKSRKNVHYFLEKHMDDVDIVFVQEPPWRFMKKVPSSNNKDGDDYEHTVSHREFIIIGAAKENRVMTYIHKKWKHLTLKLNMSVANHSDIQCVELSMPNGDIICFLNVYNDPDQFKALEYLEQRFDTMPDIHVMTGDFNLHHPVWDTQVDFAGHQKHREQAEELLAITYGGLHLDLATDPQGRNTWSLHRRDQKDSIIDLVFIGDGYTLIGAPEPTKDSWMNSDHSPVFFKLNIETYTPRKPHLKCGSKEAVNFVDHVCKALDAAMPTGLAGYPNRQLVEDMEDTIENIFLNS